jgi:hypothetical protein
MNHEKMEEAIAELLISNQRLSLPKFKISARKYKSQYKVTLNKVEHLFETAEKAASFYFNKCNSLRFISHMEKCSKEVEKWPEWKRNLIKDKREIYTKIDL